MSNICQEAKSKDFLFFWEDAIVHEKTTTQETTQETAQKSAEKVRRKLGIKLGKNELKILNIIAGDKFATINLIANDLECNPADVLRRPFRVSSKVECLRKKLGVVKK